MMSSFHLTMFHLCPATCAHAHAHAYARWPHSGCATVFPVIILQRFVNRTVPPQNVLRFGALKPAVCERCSSNPNRSGANVKNTNGSQQEFHSLNVHREFHFSVLSDGALVSDCVACPFNLTCVLCLLGAACDAEKHYGSVKCENNATICDFLCL